MSLTELLHKRWSTRIENTLYESIGASVHVLNRIIQDYLTIPFRFKPWTHSLLVDDDECKQTESLFPISLRSSEVSFRLHTSRWKLRLILDQPGAPWIREAIFRLDSDGRLDWQPKNASRYEETEWLHMSGSLLGTVLRVICQDKHVRIDVNGVLRLHKRFAFNLFNHQIKIQLLTSDLHAKVDIQEDGAEDWLAIEDNNDSNASHGEQRCLTS